MIVSYIWNWEQFSWCCPWASSAPWALCSILRSDHFTVTPPPAEPTSVNCSLPLTEILRVLSSATTCLSELRKMTSVCARACELACICSLEGNASFDFLLITQHALCSVVNCPGPLSSQWGMGVGVVVKTHLPLLHVCLPLYNLSLYLSLVSLFAPRGCK